MMRDFSLPGWGLMVFMAATIPATQATAQSSVDALGDPAEIFGYSVDKTEEPDTDGVVAKVLQALEQTEATAQQIQMTFGVENFHFVPLQADEMDKVEPEIAKREAELTELRTALEASAIFYSALQSESVDLASIVAVELAETDSGLPSDKKVTVYFSE